MQLPKLLSRNNPRLSKKDFGSLLLIAGSPTMLGAAALCSRAAMRWGAGLVTAAVPKSLNLTLQKKIAHVVMTMPLPQTSQGFFSFQAYAPLRKVWDRFDVVAIGPGIGRDASTLKLARQVILECPKPLVVDADALFALAQDIHLLGKAKGKRLLTPHAGEMARLAGHPILDKDNVRRKEASCFALCHGCVVVLKGHHTVVASSDGKIYVNRTGNVGMATAGSGDVLCGMITAFLGQGMSAFDAARYGVYYHGKAGDRAAKKHGKLGMIATDLYEF
ncbi:MAG: NAD(P)H-hydrate dehydratase [Candidatus Omnitrophica bacterium]|nr:NAD(P)H-hydrate dehydratase [Candidatus Omnitrophota bacterium]